MSEPQVAGTGDDVAPLRPDETQLVGGLAWDGARMRRDAVADRIVKLTGGGHLRHLADREGGWTKLYRDPRDGRLWELTLPHSEMHGGGPPTLTVLDPDEAARLYGAETLRD